MKFPVEDTEPTDPEHAGGMIDILSGLEMSWDAPGRDGGHG